MVMFPLKIHKNQGSKGPRVQSGPVGSRFTSHQPQIHLLPWWPPTLRFSPWIHLLGWKLQTFWHDLFAFVVVQNLEFAAVESSKAMSNQLHSFIQLHFLSILWIRCPIRDYCSPLNILFPATWDVSRWWAPPGVVSRAWNCAIQNTLVDSVNQFSINDCY